jgi:hypothetical protein
MVRSVDIAKNEMAPVSQVLVGEQDRPATRIDRCGIVKAGGRSVEDNGCGR